MAKPRIERAASRIEDRTDRSGFDLHEIDVFGVPKGLQKEQLVERCAATQRELAG